MAKPKSGPFKIRLTPKALQLIAVRRPELDAMSATELRDVIVTAEAALVSTQHELKENAAFQAAKDEVVERGAAWKRLLTTNDATADYLTWRLAHDAPTGLPGGDIEDDLTLSPDAYEQPASTLKHLDASRRDALDALDLAAACQELALARVLSALGRANASQDQVLLDAKQVVADIASATRDAIKYQRAIIAYGLSRLAGLGDL